MAERISQNIVVKSPNGLHVRPAEVVAKAAMQFESLIFLEFEGHQVDAKSILHIMTLGARQGAQVLVVAEGPDAPQAIEKMAELIGGDFECDEDESVTQERAS